VAKEFLLSSSCIPWVLQYVLTVTPKFRHNPVRYPEAVPEDTDNGKEIFSRLLIVPIEVKKDISVRYYETFRQQRYVIKLSRCPVSFETFVESGGHCLSGVGWAFFARSH
jgi:hypothetical protein